MVSQDDMVLSVEKKVVVRNSESKELEEKCGLPVVVATPFMHSYFDSFK